MARSRPSGGRRRARPAVQTPPKPPPSPAWVPALGLVLIALGVVVILANYLVEALPGGGWSLFAGVALIGAGLIVLSGWR